MKKLFLLSQMLLFVATLFAQKTTTPTIQEGTAALKSLLLTEELQAYFPGNQTVYILTSTETCEQVQCQNFQLPGGEKQVFFGTREDFFMRKITTWLEINKVYYDNDKQVKIDYQVKGVY